MFGQIFLMKVNLSAQLIGTLIRASVHMKSRLNE